MSQEEEKLSPMLEYAAQKFAPEGTVDNNAEAGIATDTSTEQSEGTETSPEIGETENNQETVTPAAEPPAQPTVDYSEFLSKESDGLFMDVDSFKAALPKIKEYDTKVNEYQSVLNEKTGLEEKIKTMFTPANDFVKQMNDMVQAGRTAEEIDAFIKISRLDIDQMDATEVKVMSMVLKGFNETIARDIVADDYPIDAYEEGSKERTILQEKLRVSSLEDRELLRTYKKDLTAVDNSAAEQAKQKAENERLQQIADAENHKKNVLQVVPKISEKISGLGEFNLNGKDGDEAVKLNFDYAADYKADLNERIGSFFLDGQMEVNDENVALVENYIKADYLSKNFDTIAQSIFKHAEAITTEKIVNKYENRSGLPEDATNNVSVDDKTKAYQDFLQKVVKSS